VRAVRRRRFNTLVKLDCDKARAYRHAVRAARTCKLTLTRARCRTLSHRTQCVDSCNAIADIEDSGKKARLRRGRCARAAPERNQRAARSPRPCHRAGVLPLLEVQDLPVLRRQPRGGACSLAAATLLHRRLTLSARGRATAPSPSLQHNKATGDNLGPLLVHKK
jgi:hypothetical protein